MKLQGMSIIFALVCLPIILVIAYYISLQIDTITLQNMYDSKLLDATYDAMSAFELNTANEDLSSVSDSLRTIIEASNNIFMNTLATNLGMSNASKSYLEPNIPSILYTLYDGYYIYAPYRNTESNNQLESGIKPYVYYSCRYIHGNSDFIVNYTLDNYITIYGTVKGTYVTKSGYLIDTEKTNSQGTTYNGCAIGKEVLTENVLMKVGSNYQTVNCIYKFNGAGKKVYSRDGGNSWFTYVNETQIPVKDVPQGREDSSAQAYYKEAWEFTNWVNNNLRDVEAKDAQDVKDPVTGEKIFKNDSSKIFAIGKNNDPEELGSNFTEHRRAIIKNSIQTNLNNAIANYSKLNAKSTYNFKMPILTEPDWSNILDNVCVISFMQGMPIGSKYYNGYSIVANNKNKEIANVGSIYFVRQDSNQTGEYHDLRCSKIAKDTTVVGYSNIDFERRSIPYRTNEDGEQEYKSYYPHTETGDYSCIVSSGTLQDQEINTLPSAIKKAYYQATARIKYNLYKTNVF